ncbi:MAG: hypothetical protein NC123_16085 [Butyrivibrio sp.]|nr:hypothetical protein [Acetatifactor muris]MCM1561039.1 hypothetical protein [Butyrivibrio sp.]
MSKIKISDVAEQIRGVSYKPEDVLDGPGVNASGIAKKRGYFDMCFKRKQASCWKSGAN